MAIKKNILLEIDKQNDEEISMRGNPVAINILVSNLVDNAIRYTPNNGKVLVSTKNHEEQCIIIVEDSGPGIDTNKYDKIFERFYRGQQDIDGGLIGGACLNSDDFLAIVNSF